MNDQICSNCKKKFEQPLELYNGTLACPHCKEAFSESEGLKNTPENEELYRLSEIYYLRYISPQKGAVPAPVTANSNELLKNAISYCASAAQTGNVRAIFKMGFYHEFYMANEKSEIVRARMAFKYYSSICSVKGRIDETPGFTNDDFQALRRRAAERILAVYEKFPRAFSDKKDATPPYTRENVKKIIEACGVILPDNDTAQSGNVDPVTRIYTTLCSTYQSKRPPLFGMFLLTGNQVNELLKSSSTQGKRKFNVDVMREKLCFHYCPCNEDGTRRASENAYFTAIRQGVDVTDDLADEKYVYFFFYNNEGKHNYLKKKDIKKVKDDLLDEDSCIYRLIGESSSTEFLFFCDDIVYHKSAEDLINAVCGEG